MDDLVQWLGEQYDEDKRAAWAWQDRRCDGCGTPVAARGVYGLVKCTACDPGDVPLTNDRVLREIDAKRDLLRFAQGVHDHHETFTTGVASRLEATLRLFALPYADRPGYREEWRP